MNRIVAAAALALAAAVPRPPTDAERIRALPEEERRWLTEFAAPIILPEERRAFLQLSEPYQREFFKADFWQRREREGLPRPLGPGYRFRYAELRQLADEKYDGWSQDAGRMVLRWGEPDAVLSPRCAGEEAFFSLEVWTYGPSTGAASGRHILYRPAHLAPRKLWTVRDEIGETTGLNAAISRFEPPFQPNSCRFTMRSLRYDCYAGTDHCAPCEDYCQVYRAYLEIRARQRSSAGALTEQASLFEPPKISTEGLDRQKDRWAATSNSNAKPIHIEGEHSAATPTPSSASAAAATPTLAPERRHSLSDEEIRDRILHLERPYRDWLDVAIPLLTREDLSRFLQMSSPEKDRFIQAFWKDRK